MQRIYNFCPSRGANISATSELTNVCFLKFKNRTFVTSNSKPYGLKIAVNTRLLLPGKLEGIGWFTYETLKRITQAHPEHEFLFLFDRKFSDEFIFSDNVTPIIVPLQARHPILFWLWFEWLVPPILRKNDVDLFLSPDGYLSLNSEKNNLRLFTISILNITHVIYHGLLVNICVTFSRNLRRKLPE